MKFATIFALASCALFSTGAAWSKEDHEIFRLHDEVRAAEGPDATFYDFIGVSPSVSQDELNKAYRKKSRQLHPDKARQTFVGSYALKKNKNKNKKPGVRVTKGPTEKEINKFMKEASERFARLGLVASVLRGSGRDRYDHFLKNGFPKWRGTGYYYERFRPGLGSVLFGLFVFGGGGMHYLALYFGWKQQRDLAERFVRNARRMAWGDETGIAGIPEAVGGTETPPPSQQRQETPDGWEDGGPTNRRQKRMMEKEARKGNKGAKAAAVAAKARSSGISTPVEAEITSGPRGAKKRVVAENGKVLIVDSAGNVYLEEDTEDGETLESLIDPNEVPPPTVRDTFLYRLPIWAYRRSVGKFLGQGPSPLDDLPTNAHPGEETSAEDAMLNHATAPNRNAEVRKRKLKR